MPVSRTTSRRRALVAAAVVGGLVAAAPPATADEPEGQGREGWAPPAAVQPFARAATAAVTGEDLAAAMDIPADSLISVDLLGSDERGFAISDGVPVEPEPEPEPDPEDPGDPEGPGPVAIAALASDGPDFPSGGSDFLVMSSGDASHAMLPNTSTNLSTYLDGTDNEDGNDLVQLHLRLDPPDGARCAAFDFAFLSEEYPEWVGSSYNDAFTAQLGTGETRIVDGAVEADSNAAQDEQGNPVTINTVFGMSSGTGTTYDGGTSRLRAFVPVLGWEMDLYLTIQDLGDSGYDSAAFIDNFFWSTDQVCRFGSTEDTDSDGLLDEWETDGLTLLTDDGQTFLDLPTMGADPTIPDIFVEVDHMADDDHSHRPEPEAIAEVVDTFAARGIHLHVDYGVTAPLTWGDQPLWGSLSRAERLDHREHLGDNGAFGWFGYQWGAFDDLKEDHFDEVRAAAFHYNVWSHSLSEQLGTTSGMSRGVEGGASDFVVSLGGWADDVGTVDNQAGTFMHELGHNLALGHGGSDSENHKPNYLSVMNYLFQSGLPEGNTGRAFDYSSSAFDDLDEDELVEADGIGAPEWWETSHRACVDADGDHLTRDSAADAIDWSCDGDTDDTVSRDVNGDGDISTLVGAQDWSNLVFTGGSIGMPGGLVDLPAETVLDEPEMTHEDYLELTAPEGPEELAVPVVTTAPTGPAGPTVVGTPVEVAQAFTTTVGDGSDVAASWTWSDGSVTEGTVATDPATGGLVARGSHAFAQAGLHEATVTLTAPGGAVTSQPVGVVVVDPAAGGTTVLGLLTPAAGAAPASPTARGSAVLAMDVRYASGRPAPVGGSLLTWVGARLVVVGHSADWLVVAGGRSVVESAASVNGKPGFRQRVTTVAGAAPTVRVQVWDPARGGIADPAAVVLDTAPGGAAGRLTGVVLVGR